MQPIVSNMPIPQIKRKGAKSKYPWRDMQPGDAFKFESEVTMAGATGLAYQTGRNIGMKFAVRLMDDGIYCWRIDGTPYATANGNYRPTAERIDNYGATTVPAKETVVVGPDDDAI